MKENQNIKSSRRKFLSLGLLSSAALVTNKVQAMTPAADDGEKVSMLTADGKLVEVSKTILEQSTSREKVRNQEILKWRKDPNPTKS